MAGFLSRLVRPAGKTTATQPPGTTNNDGSASGAAFLFQYDSATTEISAPPVPGPLASAQVVLDRFSSLPGAFEELGKLVDGWRVERLVVDFPPFVIVELCRLDPAGTRTGETGCWVFDQDGRFLGNTPDALAPSLLARACEIMLAAMVAREDDAASYRRLREGLAGLERAFRLKFLQRVFAASPLPVMAALGYGPDQDRRLRVVDAPGGVSVVIDEDLEWPVTLERTVAAPFRSGWKAVDVLTCFAPLLMLELRDDAGNRSTWVLNASLERIDGEEFASAETVAVLRQLAPPMIRRHWRQIVTLADTDPAHIVLPMLRLNSTALHRMLQRVADLVVPETIDHMVPSQPSDIVLSPAPTYPDGLLLRGEHIGAAIGRSLYQAGRDAIRQGRFTWPSPVDGSEAELEAVIVPQEYTIIYQFLDRNGLRFMVATGERDCVQMGLYLPYENRFLCRGEPANWWFRHAIPAEFWRLVYEHCLLNSAIIAGRRRGPEMEMVNVFMALPLLHIGHYVWNDLTGQAALVRELGADAPRSFILGAQGGEAEFFGPLEMLFADLRGKIDRSLPDKAAFSRLVYNSNVVPIRFTRTFIDAALRDVVQRYVMTTSAYTQAAQQRADHGDVPILIVGIRLEDRTFVDSAQTYQALVDHLDRRHPGTVIVLDGRNSRPGGRQGDFFASIKDMHAIRSPLEAELELVARLRDYVVGTSIVVVSTVGQPVEASMAWCYLADACFSPWGAGLAKYRWLANLPSVIPTSRHNLLHRTDLDIYHATRWMESPAPLVMPDPDKVTDDAGKRGNAPSDSDKGGRECFDVDLPHLFGLLDRLLAQLGRHPAVPHEESV